MPGMLSATEKHSRMDLRIFKRRQMVCWSDTQPSPNVFMFMVTNHCLIVESPLIYAFIWLIYDMHNLAFIHPFPLSLDSQ